MGFERWWSLRWFGRWDGGVWGVGVGGGEHGSHGELG